eukprot:COSAG03_NODE_19648_length_332_cov_17.347639_1_plen_90_part_01
MSTAIVEFSGANGLAQPCTVHDRAPSESEAQRQRQRQRQRDSVCVCARAFVCVCVCVCVTCQLGKRDGGSWISFEAPWKTVALNVVGAVR